MSIFTEILPQRHWVKSIHKWVTEDVKDGSGLQKKKQKEQQMICVERQRGALSDTYMQGVLQLAEATMPSQLTWRFGGFSSSLGTISMRKSNWSNFVIAMAISFLCNKEKLGEKLAWGETSSPSFIPSKLQDDDFSAKPNSHGQVYSWNKHSRTLINFKRSHLL